MKLAKLYDIVRILVILGGSASILTACSDSVEIISPSGPSGDDFSERLDSKLMPLISSDEELEATGQAEEKAARDVMLSRRQAARFLNVATFGSTPKSVRDLQQIGRNKWLSMQMSKPNKSNHFAAMRDRAYRNVNDENVVGFMDSKEFITNQMWKTWIEAPDQLRKRVAAALLEIFVVTARVDDIGIRNNQMVAGSFVDLLEKHAFGNYRDLLYDVSRHPAMAHYLSFINNRKAEYGANGEVTRIPDENYAREILQLFSIGLYELNPDGTLALNAKGKPVETYKQKDVENLARVFTGWTRESRFDMRLQNDPTQHSPEEKKFLRLTIPENTPAMASLDRAINHIFSHDNVGPFIGKQLIQRLVTSNPTPAFVERISAVFSNDGAGRRGNLGAVVKAILLDPESRVIPVGHRKEIHGKLREPMMRLTAVARMLGDKSRITEYYPISNTSDISDGIAQAPLQSSSVFNFFRPNYSPPASKLGKKGYVAPEFQVVTGSAIPGSVVFINKYIDSADQHFMKRNWKKLDAYAKTPGKLVNFLALLMTGRKIPKNDRNNMIKEIKKIGPPRERSKAALQMITSHPEFIIQR